MLCIFSNVKFKLIPVLIFALIFYSCETVKTSYIDKEKIPAEKDREFQGAIPKITGVILNNGSFIDLKDKNAKLDFLNGNKSISYDISESKRGSISFNDIAKVKVDFVHGSIITPIAIIAGLAVYTVIMLLYVFFSLPRIISGK